MLDIALASLLGLGTTSSALLGAATGLYLPMPKRVLACVLAFAAGALISALAIELAFESAVELHRDGFTTRMAWSFVGGGFALGAVIYYWLSLALEQRGAAIRYPTRFREYAVERRRQDRQEQIRLLSHCALLRHLPPEAIEALLPCVRTVPVRPGAMVFRAGDPGDALYIVARGEVEILPQGDGGGPAGMGSAAIARLGEGQAFGEMALLTGGARTASARAASDVLLLAIAKPEFDALVGSDRQLAHAVERLSHQRAITNLSAGGPHSATWARIASESLEHLSRHEAARLLQEAGRGAGLAIVFGNILDTIPGCLVIGARFTAIENVSLTLALGMFLGGIPEAAASAAILRKAGYRPLAIFGLWATVLLAGVIAAGAGKAFIAGSDSLAALFCEAVAGGAVLALIAHAMIPEAIDEGGSLIVLPTVAGFLFALYLALAESFGP
jgi:CRP-like cAMP-binding protein